MTPTTSYNFGDIILVPFPFTDQSTTKKRPAVVVSSDAYHATRPDIIIMAVTSQTTPSGKTGEVSIKNWKDAGLLKPSLIKPVIATIENSLVLRRLGQLKEHEQQTLRKAIDAIVG